jgi:hypothetical protein
MSQKIQDALDLPVLENLLKASAQDTAAVNAEPESEMNFEEEDELSNSFENALSQGRTTKELEDSANAKDHAVSMDDIYDETIQHAKDLMDLGYNVDTRSSGRIFENAATMYKIALDAKNSKRKAQLDLIKAHQEQQKIDIVERKNRGDNGDPNVIESQSVIIEDRNDLIKRLRDEQSSNK